MRHVPDQKDLFPKELGNKSSVAVTDLDRVSLKVLMEDDCENHHCRLLPLMMKTSRRQLGALNAESFVECINSASKIVMEEGDYTMGHGMLNELVTL